MELLPKTRVIKNCTARNPMPKDTKEEEGVSWFHHDSMQVAQAQRVLKVGDQIDNICKQCGTHFITTLKAAQKFNEDFVKRHQAVMAEMCEKGWDPNA